VKNSLMAFAMATLIVAGATSVRRSVAGIGTSPIPLPPKQPPQVMSAFGIGTSPIPLPPKHPAHELSAFGIGTSPIPLPPKQPGGGAR